MCIHVYETDSDRAVIENWRYVKHIRENYMTEGLIATAEWYDRDIARIEKEAARRGIMDQLVTPEGWDPEKVDWFNL